MFNKKIGILNLSNPVSRSISSLVEKLKKGNNEVKVSPLLHDEKASPKEKADLFNQWVKEDLDFIFDVSGGDLANTTIPYIDLEAFRRSRTLFAGYSDLTCVLNVLAPLRPVLLLQIANCTNPLHPCVVDRENVAGGNIRCFLKLAQTSFFPDCQGKTLFLESYSGNRYRIESYFAQLSMMGVFSQIDRLMLGNFTELLAEPDGQDQLERIARAYCRKPIEFDRRIGHQKDAWGIFLNDRKESYEKTKTSSIQFSHTHHF